MELEELIKYNREARYRAYESGKKLCAIKFRNRNYWFRWIILKADQFVAKDKIVVLNDRRSHRKEGAQIYAATHIGCNDVQRTFQVIGEPVWLMLGDPGNLYKLPIYLALRMNGVIPFDAAYKKDRNIAYHRSLELLNRGGRLLIFPEAAYNNSPNLPVMKIFAGTVRMSMKTGAPIIPVGLERYGHVYYFNIGKNYVVPEHADEQEETRRLREKMISLKWEIMEHLGLQKRNTISANYWKNFMEEIVKSNYDLGYTSQDIENDRYHDKHVTEPKEAFAYMDNLIPNRENAFLMRDVMKRRKIENQ